MIDDVHASRRAAVLDALGTHGAGALVIPASPELRVGADGELRYQPDADLYYLTGYTEQEAVLVLCPSAASPFTMFVRPRDAERERWDGVRGGEDEAVARFGADAAYPVAELLQRLPDLVGSADVLYTPLESGLPGIDAAVGAVLAAGRRSRPRTGRGIHSITDARRLLGPMRQVKDEHEIGLMRQAARITVDSFVDAVRAVRTADGEWQVEAALEHGFRSRGGDGAAFPPIVAGGGNATVLHYTSNNDRLCRGDLLLIDAGARHGRYCADVTRTFPTAGSFSAGQRAVYDVVLAAHAAAVAAIRPGGPADASDSAALDVLVAGMIDLGLLDDGVDRIMEQKEYRRYFPHRTSHWLGLDVHDVGDYVGAHGAPLTLAPGMVLTVEPGLYVPLDDDRAPAGLRGLGVRLEDDVLVTTDGAELLTGGLAIRPDDVESMM